jgi:anti-sigma B factor antagonist
MPSHDGSGHHSGGAVVELRSETVTCPGHTADHFEVLVRPEGEFDVLTVAGEIDLASAPALHATLHGLLAHGRRRLQVDLGEVTFVDATCLTFLLTAIREVTAAGGSVVVVRHNPLLTRLLEATDLTDVVLQPGQ